MLQAECAEIRYELGDHLDRFSVNRITQAALAHVDDDAPNLAAEAIRQTDAEAAVDIADHEACQTHVQEAIAIIDRGGHQAYEQALEALHADTREWWEEELAEADTDEEGAAEPTASALRRALEEEVLPFHAGQLMALRHRDLLRSQAFGIALRHADLERLNRYETTLDRKLQRILGMLLQLQDRRRTIDAKAA